MLPEFNELIEERALELGRPGTDNNRKSDPLTPTGQGSERAKRNKGLRFSVTTADIRQCFHQTCQAASHKQVTEPSLEANGLRPALRSGKRHPQQDGAARNKRAQA